MGLGTLIGQYARLLVTEGTGPFHKGVKIACRVTGLTGLDAPAILARLLAGFPTRVLEEQPLRFQCRCSRERVDAAIVAMGRAELIDVLAHERRAEVVCEFCGARYVVEEPELRALVPGS